MRYLIISDIHANLAAFEAVLADAKGRYDKVWCLGDMVGYGPDPNECVELLWTLDHICLAGNHDWAAVEKLDIDDFNPDARVATLWTTEQLTNPVRRYLESLPMTLIEEEMYTLVHGGPRHPIWEYVITPKIAQANFRLLRTPYCFVGHTHHAIIFQEATETDPLGDAWVLEPNSDPMPLGEERLIINPGSIGQPRDDDPRAAYGILDTETRTFEYRRVDYPIDVTQEKMKNLDFPVSLWERLAIGR
jgi:diadenosine tetraphosphatase ApaH/serine/threonine PP2A family protein phosphatase